MANEPKFKLPLRAMSWRKASSLPCASTTVANGSLKYLCHTRSAVVVKCSLLPPFAFLFSSGVLSSGQHVPVGVELPDGYWLPLTRLAPSGVDVGATRCGPTASAPA